MWASDGFLSAAPLPPTSCSHPIGPTHLLILAVGFVSDVLGFFELHLQDLHLFLIFHGSVLYYLHASLTLISSLLCLFQILQGYGQLLLSQVQFLLQQLDAAVESGCISFSLESQIYTLYLGD